MNPFLTNNFTDHANFIKSHTAQEVMSAISEAGIINAFDLHKHATVQKTATVVQKSTICPCGITRTDCDYHK